MAISLEQNIFLQYIIWYCFEVSKKILGALKNFLAFNLQFFSIFELLKTFFAPWRRYSFSYPRGFDVGKYVEVFFSNLISRILGAIMRSFLIILGLVVEVLILFLGAIVFFAWLLLPFVLVIIFYLSFYYAF